jgi:hypothetical protein
VWRPNAAAAERHDPSTHHDAVPSGVTSIPVEDVRPPTRVQACLAAGDRLDLAREAELRTLPLFFAAMLAIGCGAPKDREIRLDRLDAEKRSLEATFDRLEERLVVNQARVRFWKEMRERHESVSAIACVSQDEHAMEMALHSAPPPRSSMHRSRVAAMGGPVAVERVPAASGGGGSR